MTVPQAERAVSGVSMGVQALRGTGCGVGAPSGAPDGLSFMFLDGKLARVDVSGPSTIATASGVRVGATEKQVDETYPGRITVAPAEYDPQGRYLIYTPTPPSDRLFLFETDGRLVTSYRAGLCSAVELGGCA